MIPSICWHTSEWSRNNWIVSLLSSRTLARIDRLNCCCTSLREWSSRWSTRQARHSGGPLLPDTTHHLSSWLLWLSALCGNGSILIKTDVWLKGGKKMKKEVIFASPLPSPLSLSLFYIHARARTRTHTHMDTYIQIFMCTHTHIHARARSLSISLCHARARTSAGRAETKERKGGGGGGVEGRLIRSIFYGRFDFRLYSWFKFVSTLRSKSKYVINVCETRRKHWSRAVRLLHCLQYYYYY